MVKTGNSVFSIWQPCSSEKFDKASIRVLVHTNLNLATKIMFRTKISHKIDLKATKPHKLVKTGNSVFYIWQPCASGKFVKASIRFLVQANVSLATKIMFRTKISHNIEKKATKPHKLVKTGNSVFNIWQPCALIKEG